MSSLWYNTSSSGGAAEDEAAGCWEQGLHWGSGSWGTQAAQNYCRGWCRTCTPEEGTGSGEFLLTLLFVCLHYFCSDVLVPFDLVLLLFVHVSFVSLHLVSFPFVLVISFCSCWSCFSSICWCYFYSEALASMCSILLQISAKVEKVKVTAFKKMARRPFKAQPSWPSTLKILEITSKDLKEELSRTKTIISL